MASEDLRDILGEELFGSAESRLDSAVTQILNKPKRSRAPPPTRQRGKRKTGLEREIAALQASQPVAAQTKEETKGFELKEKRKAVSTPAERWVRRGFQNSARTDNQMFQHWAKKESPVAEYPFAIFNKKLIMFEYDDTQYNAYFRSHEWSREETDLLMSMCKQYDQRFIVIADKWTVSMRTIEDLKDRFYFIQRKLLEATSSKTDETWKQHPLIAHPYDKNQEINRKKQLEDLGQKNSSQVEEEEQLLQKANGITTVFKKHDKELKKTLKIASKIVKGSTSHEGKKKNKGRGGRASTGGRDSAGASALSLPAQKLQKYNQQVNEAMQTLGVPTKPTSTNPQVTVKYNNIRNTLTLLFELQRLEAESLYQLQVLIEQKKILDTEHSQDQPIEVLLQQQQQLQQKPSAPFTPGKVFQSANSSSLANGIDSMDVDSDKPTKDLFDDDDDDDDKDSDDDDDQYNDDDDDMN